MSRLVNLRVAVRRYSQRKSDHFSNAEAIKAIGILRRKKTKLDDSQLAHHAIDIYHKTDNKHDVILIRSLLHLFLHFRYAEKCLLIWDDIESTLSANTRTVDEDKQSMLSSLADCCCKSHSIDIGHCLQVLEWIAMESDHDRDTFLVKLIGKYRHKITEIQHIHQYLTSNAILSTDNEMNIHTALINAYSKCKHLEQALCIFDSMQHKDIVCINAMMTAYLDNNHAKQALILYNSTGATMHDTVSHILALKACAYCNNVEKGRMIHAQCNDATFEQDGRQYINLQNTLIDFYGEFADIETARAVFDDMQFEHKNTGTLNAMMKALLNNQCASEAVDIYNEYKLLRNNLSHLLAIKACAASNDYECGRNIHARALFRKSSDHYIWTELINFYGHFGDIGNALSVFNSVDERQKNAALVSAMMKSLMNNADHEMQQNIVKALDLYYKYQSIQDDVSHLLAIKACIKLNDFQQGKRIHCSLTSDDFSLNLKNTLMDFYGHFGDISTCKQLFKADGRNSSSLNVVMKSLIGNNACQEALRYFNDHKALHDATSMVLALKACIQANDADIGHQLRDCITSEMRNDPYLQCALIECHGHFGDVQEAENIWNCMDRTSVALNTMMTMYNNQNMHTYTLQLYEQNEDLHDDVTELLAITACTQSKNYDKGQHIIDQLNSNNVRLQCAIIDFYGHFDDIESAASVYRQIEDAGKDAVCISTMMNAFIRCDRNEDALLLYEQEISNNIRNNTALHRLALKACVNLNDTEHGKQIYTLCTQQMECSDEIVSILADFYAHFGDIDSIKQSFERLKIVHISAIELMLIAYRDNGMNAECFHLFQDIAHKYRLKPSAKCYSIVLQACAENAKYRDIIYEELKADEELIFDASIQTDLINAYAQNGDITKCEEIFQIHTTKLKQPEITVWNAMIKAYGINGEAQKAKQIFDALMEMETLSGDCNTFVFILNALSHSGEAELAMDIWQNQIQDDSKKYDLYVMTSLVDCLSRKGLLNKAKQMMNEYEQRQCTQPDITMLMALLSGCVNNVEKEMAQEIYHKIECLFKQNLQILHEAQLLISNLA